MCLITISVFRIHRDNTELGLRLTGFREISIELVSELKTCPTEVGAIGGDKGVVLQYGIGSLQRLNPHRRHFHSITKGPMLICGVF